MSSGSVSLAISKLKLLQQNLSEVNRVFIQKSLDYIELQAMLHLEETTGNGSYIPTGQLMSSFIKENDGTIGNLINTCFYSALVEYGTGIRGVGTYEGTLPEGYKYDVNSHGERGWVYMGTDGQFHWTDGMPAHNFMFRALNDYLYSTEYKRLFSEAFNEVCGGVFK